MMAHCSKLLVWHTKTNVLRTSDMGAAIRIVSCWWSADEDIKWWRLTWWHSFEVKMALVLYELGASANKMWTRFALRWARSFRVRVTWSCWPTRATRRAAAFWTRSSGAMVDLERPAKIALQYSNLLNTSDGTSLAATSGPRSFHTCFSRRMW